VARGGADAHPVRRADDDAQQMRILLARWLRSAGMHDAESPGMRSDETWTIPLHIIMWTTIVVGLIMAMAVVMMH
jgi:hypothetical protein